MGKKDGLKSESISPEVERSGTGGDTGQVKNLRGDQGPDPEVHDKGLRRTFTAGYKLRVLEEIDRCQPGEIAAIIRREGLYYSNIQGWQRQRLAGTLSGLQGKQRGPKNKRVDAEYVRRLEREIERLMRKLEQAEGIIEIQKKIASLLGTGKPEEI